MNVIEGCGTTIIRYSSECSNFRFLILDYIKEIKLLDFRCACPVKASKFICKFNLKFQVKNQKLLSFRIIMFTFKNSELVFRANTSKLYNPCLANISIFSNETKSSLKTLPSKHYKNNLCLC